MSDKHIMLCQCCSRPIAEFDKLTLPLTPDQFDHVVDRLKGLRFGPFDQLYRVTGKIQCYNCQRIAHSPEGYIKIAKDLFIDPKTNQRLIYDPKLKTYEVHPDDYETIYKCDHCDFQTAYKVALSGHMKTHKGKK